jgi:hypothetical protein
MKSPRSLRFARALLLVAVLLGGAGCAPRDPLERTISVPTLSRFASWRSHLASDANADTVRRVEVALQEIRLSITGERELGPLRARTGRRLIDAPFGAADEVPVTKRH